MLSQLIQRQIPIGSTVTFSLKDGREIHGTLIEIGRDHVTIEGNNETITILTDQIGTWRVSQENAPNNEKTSLPKEENLSSKPSMLGDQSVTRKLLEIEARFKTKTQSATLNFHIPDFVLPETEIKGQNSDAATAIWNRVKDKYFYAEKINELSLKFGRIQPIIIDLRNLADQFKGSNAIRRHLGYLYWLSGNQKEAFDLYYELALRSKNAWDWHNLATLALSHELEEVACYALEQFFRFMAISEMSTAWYVYVKLLEKYSNYQALLAICENEEKSCSDQEMETIFETSLYFLISNDKEKIATNILCKQIDGQPTYELIKEALAHLDTQPKDSYLKIAEEMAKKVIEENQQKEFITHEPQGYIYEYKVERNYGFLKGVDGNNYFFHRSAISDDDLLSQIRTLRPGKKIPVTFEVAQGPRGPVAIGVALYRTINEMFRRAIQYADEGEYPKAIAQIKRVLDLNPENNSAREYYEKWREYARLSGVPRGSNPYARAKRVQLIEKDLERAIKLLRDAINQKDNVESAVKDLAALLAQLGRVEEAIKVLEQNRTKIRDQQSVDNMLIGFYQVAGQHDKSIALLESKLRQTTTEGKKAAILWQIGNSYLRKEDYVNAEKKFREALVLQPDNRTLQRNIAICLFKQARYDEAQRILDSILLISPDAQVADLLEAIKQARATGQFNLFDAIAREALVTELIVERSRFTEFLLSRCEFRGISPDRIKKGDDGKQIYIGSRRDARHDIERLEDIAKQLGTRRPSERADYYLTAARISETDDPNQFYQYLCRSFSSRGDSFVTENKPLDSARELYSEALAVYDGYRNPGKGEERYDEQDAVNALVRYMYSWLGRDSIPTISPKRNEQESILKQQIQYIDDAIEDIITRYPQREKIFDAISHLIFRSKYAGERILRSLYSRYSLQAIALDYLQQRGIESQPNQSPKKIDDFINLWNDYQRKRLESARNISNEIRFLSNIEIYPASLASNIERLKAVAEQVFLDLDRQRLEHIQIILEIALELCKQEAFEEQERLCLQIDSRCQDLLREIESSPTKLSVEEIYPVVEAIQKKIKIKLDDLYLSSTPQINLRLPVEIYTPDADRRIEAQIVVSNRVGCSPAESLELVIQEYEDTFTVRSNGSLRGGDQHILKVPLQVSEEACRSRAFSLPIYAQFRTRSGDILQTDVQNFSIRLDSEEEFKEIDNPYAAYAEGGVVGDPEMFFGRDELITNIAKALQSSRTQSKCVVIYGQKRAGKSSILHHLKAKLKSDPSVLILDLGNIGSILDEHSSSPFLYQILWSILKKLYYAIEDQENAGWPQLGLSFPTDKEFYSDHSPLMLFKDVFDRFRRATSKFPEWHNIRLILLIDEFSYIYGYIEKGKIPESFMKNWKALLQENYFNAVLVGQDVMPKFKQRFPNEFGTTQDERVTYLRRDDAIRLIDEPIRIGGRYGESRYRERAIDRILDLTAGSPFYIQILCNRLVEYMNHKRASLVTEADVEQVKDELIRGVNALGLDKFDNLINSGDTSEDSISDEDALKVLTSIAINSKTGPCNRNSIVCETQIPIDVILEDLVKRDVIERERGQYYSIRVGLFKEWLIAHQ